MLASLAARITMALSTNRSLPVDFRWQSGLNRNDSRPWCHHREPGDKVMAGALCDSIRALALLPGAPGRV